MVLRLMRCLLAAILWYVTVLATVGAVVTPPHDPSIRMAVRLMVLPMLYVISCALVVPWKK